MGTNGRAQKFVAANGGGGTHLVNGIHHDPGRGGGAAAAHGKPEVVTTATTSAHPHAAFPAKVTTAPTTVVARPSSATLANVLACPHGEPAEMLRQTLNSAPNSRPASRASSRRRHSSTPTTPRTILTPSGSAENSEGEALPDDSAMAAAPQMRHGFEDEYNSEDYLAVLEQV